MVTLVITAHSEESFDYAESVDFGEPADSPKSDNFGKFVKPVDSGESDYCGEYAYSEESFDYAESIDSGDFVESSYPCEYEEYGNLGEYGDFDDSCESQF